MGLLAGTFDTNGRSAAWNLKLKLVSTALYDILLVQTAIFFQLNVYTSIVTVQSPM